MQLKGESICGKNPLPIALSDRVKGYGLFRSYPLEKYMQPAWPLTLFYDGDCPLCAREIRHLRRHADPACLLFTDVADPAFEAPAPGMSSQQFRDLLHARFADGQWVKGLDATYWSWRAAGLGRWQHLLPGSRCGRCLIWVIACFCAFARNWPGFLIRKAPSAARMINVRFLRNRTLPAINS